MRDASAGKVAQAIKTIEIAALILKSKVFVPTSMVFPPPTLLMVASMMPLEWRDLVYDPDVRTHYGPASHARMAALHERLKAVLAKANADEAARRAALESAAETGGSAEE